ncbi:MAG TPA: hypothetical protein VHG91_20595 [Longimicrobium sp.]|nr:hypothetical protein [Longimicrobium sp.]
MRVVFDAGRQRWKVWFVTAISLVCGGVLVWLGGYLFQRFGLDPSDGGVLRPLGQRLALGGAFALGGVAVIAGILAYLQCYVTRIEESEAGDEFRVTVAGINGARLRSVRPEDVARAGYSDGRYDAGGVKVNAPWYSIRLLGRRLPLIVDLQGDFHDPDAVDRLMEGAPDVVAP